jgi:hypothetical protein
MNYIIPDDFNPQSPFDEHRAIDDIRRIVFTTLIGSPIDSSQLINVARTMCAGASLLQQLALELVQAENRAAHHEALAECERQNGARDRE